MVNKVFNPTSLKEMAMTVSRITYHRDWSVMPRPPRILYDQMTRNKDIKPVNEMVPGEEYPILDMKYVKLLSSGLLGEVLPDEEYSIADLNTFVEYLSSGQRILVELESFSVVLPTRYITYIARQECKYFPNKYSLIYKCERLKACSDVDKTVEIDFCKL